MKKCIYIVLLTIAIAACNENKFLSETPLEFMGGSNSYITKVDFEASITELY